MARVSMMAAGVLLALMSRALAVDDTVDVLVYAANPAGVAAGIAAANGVGARHRVRVMEPLRMIGGMAVAGGVGLMNNQQGVYGQGLGGQWCALNGAAYGNASKPNCFPEMHVGERSMWAMVNATANLTVTLGCRLTGVTKTGGDACVTTATFLCANDTEAVTIAASVFIDASYDGDGAIMAGVDHAWGREAASEFNESLAGVNTQPQPNESFQNSNVTISPYWDDGSLLKYISPDPMPAPGTGDDRLMAFSYFYCGSPLADGRAIPWPKPPGYNASDFELLRRVIDAYVAQGKTFELGDFTEFQYYSTGPNVSKILMCCGKSPLNMDQPDLNRGWANATWEQRQAMAAAHHYYLQGSLYFMANDPRVNNYTRYAIGRWGLCADEYVGFDNLPPQIYVRISNRIRGEVTGFLTANNLTSPQWKADSIAVGNWEMDQHIESRRAVVDPHNASQMIVANEGYFRDSFPGVAFNWYDLPFAALLPKRGQANNVLVPVALSATSLAYASTRIEQMYLDAGAAAGVAAALALESAPPSAPGACPGMALQDTNVTAVQAQLVARYNQRVHGPPPR